jgi:2-dehydro-3-deoxygalactonokinase
MTGTSPGGLLVDWGTSNARAWLMAEDGRQLAASQSGTGINHVEDRDFTGAFSALTRDLTSEALPTLMSGMIGSRQGWVEAPYLACPVSLKDLAQQLVPVPDMAHIRIVPGVHLQTSDGRNDVMRGEEVQIAGALELTKASGDMLMCLPGTHSKWAKVESGRLVDFSTSMTGEVYSALADHTILGALLPDQGNAEDISDAGFSQGLVRSGEDGGMLHHLFGVRAEGLFESIAAEDLQGFLSGILIGHEVRDMLARYAGTDPVTVIGDKLLAAHYVHAISSLDRSVTALDAEQATIAGLQMILNASHNP